MNRDEIEKRLKADPFITKWRENYNKNIEEGLFSNENTKPLSFLIRNKPFWGVPMVLVVAGPSLDKNIANLKNLQKKAIILSADVVFFKLLENDIIPDLVVNIDPADMFVRFWEGLDTTKSALICPTTANPDAIKAWKGQKILFNQSDVPGSSKGDALKKLTKTTEGFGYIFNQFFVGATMTQIAALFNPKPLILVGYDFAYTDNKAYCEGFLDKKIYDDTLPPGSPEQLAHIEKLKMEEIKANRTIPDIHGFPVKTNNTLIFYRDSYVQLVHKMLKLRHVINCTEGGILTQIPGLALNKAIDEFCKEEIIKKDLFAVEKRKRKKKGKSRK